LKCFSRSGYPGHTPKYAPKMGCKRKEVSLCALVAEWLCTLAFALCVQFDFLQTLLIELEFNCGCFFDVFGSLLLTINLKMTYSDQQKAKFLLKFVEEGYNYSRFKARIKRDTRQSNPRVPDTKTINNWVEIFRETGSVHGQRGKNTPK
jgi:hypothetical protein